MKTVPDTEAFARRVSTDFEAAPSPSDSSADYMPVSVHVAEGLLQRSALAHPANASVRAIALQRTQQTYGNRAAQRGIGYVQAKLKVSEPGDPLEQEADRIAEAAVSGPACACGGTCEDCANHAVAQRMELPASTARHNAADAVLPDRLGPGQALDSGIRDSMASRFGRSFDDVRIHTEVGAAEAARSLEALAYTVGNDIVFGDAEFDPGTTDGQRLLAHELAHVVQQTPSVSTGAPPVIARLASTRCTTGRHQAPANAEALISTAEFFAGITITAAGMDLSLLKLDIVLPGLGAGGGYTMPTGQRLTNYQNSFGLPSRAGGGRFRNRLSGDTFPSQAEALAHEIDDLRDRFGRLSDRLLDTAIHYRCIGGTTTIGDCEGHCRGRTATACPGNLVMLCPEFWNLSPQARALLLIHEAAHLVFSIRHASNFRHADCYATYAGTAVSTTWNGVPPCAP